MIRFLLNTVLVLLFFSSIVYSNEVVEGDSMGDIMTSLIKVRMYEQNATPWDDNIVATSAHINKTLSQEICSNEILDVKFVKDENINSVLWRDPNKDEPVEYRAKMTVFIPHEDSISDFGTEMEVNIRSRGFTLESINLTWKGKKRSDFWIGTGRVLEGMSGGAVVSLIDNAILGIIMGVPKDIYPIQRYFNLLNEEYTIFVPYKTLQKVWNEECINR